MKHNIFSIIVYTTQITDYSVYMCVVPQRFNIFIFNVANIVKITNSQI